MTSFPASNLRYLLYGGVFNPEKQTLRSGDNTSNKLFAGHTILATHLYKEKNEEKIFGKDGFLVDELIKNDLFDRFQFYKFAHY